MSSKGSSDDPALEECLRNFREHEVPDAKASADTARGKEAAESYQRADKWPHDKLRKCCQCDITDHWREMEASRNPQYGGEESLSGDVAEKRKLREMQEGEEKSRGYSQAKSRGYGVDPRYSYKCVPCLCKEGNLTITEALKVAKLPRSDYAETRAKAFTKAKTDVTQESEAITFRDDDGSAMSNTAKKRKIQQTIKIRARDLQRFFAP